MSDNNSDTDDSARTERIREIRKERAAGAPVPGELENNTIFPEDAIERASRPSLEDIRSVPQTIPGGSEDNCSLGDPILVCADCSVYYEHDDEWSYCPRCGDELQAVKGDV